MVQTKDFKFPTDSEITKKGVLNTKNKSKLGRKPTGLTEKYNVSFKKEEAEVLVQMRQETGAPITEIIRRAVIKSGIFNR